MVVRWRKSSCGVGWKYEGGFTAGFEEKEWIVEKMMRVWRMKIWR